MTRILVYGAGPLGSLFAARLQQGGNDVLILACGERLTQLREHGIVLVDVQTQEQTITQVNVVEGLAPDDAYDLVLVNMRKSHALQILPVLAANRQTPHVLFLMNNAAGPGALVEALGEERVLIGFPNSAGYREDHVVHCLSGTEDDNVYVPFGEVDGRIRERTCEVARILESSPGFGGGRQRGGFPLQRRRQPACRRRASLSLCLGAPFTRAGIPRLKPWGLHPIRQVARTRSRDSAHGPDGSWSRQGPGAG